MMVFYCPSKESPLPISHILSPRCSELNTSIYRGPIEAISFRVIIGGSTIGGVQAHAGTHRVGVLCCDVESALVVHRRRVRVRSAGVGDAR